MYELILDRSTILIWAAMFVTVAPLCLLSFVGLFYAILHGKPRRFMAGILLIFIATAAGLFYTKFTPQWFYRSKIEASIALGEEVLRRYEAYRTQHGRYPDALAEVYFPALSRFDTIIGLREDTAGCAGFGQGCKSLAVQAEGTPSPPSSTGGAQRLVVVVDDELIRCEITNLQRDWTCRDMR